MNSMNEAQFLDSLDEIVYGLAAETLVLRLLYDYSSFVDGVSPAVVDRAIYDNRCYQQQHIDDLLALRGRFYSVLHHGRFEGESVYDFGI